MRLARCDKGEVEVAEVVKDGAAAAHPPHKGDLRGDEGALSGWFGAIRAGQVCDPSGAFKIVTLGDVR